MNFVIIIIERNVKVPKLENFGTYFFIPSITYLELSEAILN